MKAKEVLRLLGITRVTLSSYVKKGIIKVTKLPNGYYNYDDDTVYKFINGTERVNVIYARVSTYKQKNDLSRQINLLQQFCNKNNVKINNIYSEISSGIDLDRPQFSLLLNEVINNKIANIYISHKDRLTRLSFITLEAIFKKFGTNIIIMNKKNTKNDLDIFEELISMMHYFSTKLYSNRRKQKIDITKKDLELEFLKY